MFDDPDLHGGLLGFELEAELLAEGSEDRWTGSVDGLAVKHSPWGDVGREVAGISELEVEAALEISAVYDWAVHELAEAEGEVVHGGGSGGQLDVQEWLLRLVDPLVAAVGGLVRNEFQAGLVDSENVRGKLFGFASEFEVEAFGEQVLKHEAEVVGGGGFVGFGVQVPSVGRDPVGATNNLLGFETVGDLNHEAETGVGADVAIAARGRTNHATGSGGLSRLKRSDVELWRLGESRCRDEKTDDGGVHAN